MEESRPLLGHGQELDSPIVAPSCSIAPDDFYRGVIQEVLIAIDNDIAPKRIVQGSSGSYFCLDGSGVSTLSLNVLLIGGRVGVSLGYPFVGTIGVTLRIFPKYHLLIEACVPKAIHLL